MAVSHLAELAANSPVLRLRSKRGKLLLEISRRMRWPARKTLLVAQRSIGERKDLPGSQQSRRVLGIAITGAQDAFGEVDGGAVGEHVDEFGGEVGVHRGRRSEELQPDRAGNFEIVLERRGGVDEHVIALFHGALITRTGREMFAVATERATDGGHGLGGIVGELVRRFVAGGRGGKRAIAAGGVGVALGVQEIFGSFGAGQAANRLLHAIGWRP